MRSLVGTLKDQASALVAKATVISTSGEPPEVVVLRATTHNPSPCHPKHIAALLSFGHDSRLAASALINALTTRLRATGDPSVVLKCLLAAHHIIQDGAFILHDQLLSKLRPSPVGGRNPLNLSAFRPSAYARWYARLLELLLASHRTLGSFPRASPDESTVTLLSNELLLLQLDVLVGIAEEMAKEPGVEEGELVGEVIRMVGKEKDAVVVELLVRVREEGERVGVMEFGELLEVGSVFTRMEGCSPLDGDPRVRVAAKSVKGMVERRICEVARKGQGKGIRGGKRIGQSERLQIPSSVFDLRFSSCRWADR